MEVSEGRQWHLLTHSPFVCLCVCADKTLGITGPQDVEKMGIAAYNAECRKIVMRYSGEWRTVVTRLGRWIDFDNDYKTLYPSFMEVSLRANDYIHVQCSDTLLRHICMYLVCVERVPDDSREGACLPRVQGDALQVRAS